MAGKKDYLSYHEFVRRLENGQIKPLYLFQGEESLPIIDKEGWETMWFMLFDYVGGPGSPRAGGGAN